METLEKLCAVCAQPLPAGSTKSREYCSKKCNAKAVRRRAKGQPIANATATPEEIANLRLQLVQQQNANVQLQEDLATTTAKLAIARRRATANQAKIATREKQNAAAQEQHLGNLQHQHEKANERVLYLQKENARLNRLLLEQAIAPREDPETAKLRDELRGAEEYAGTLLEWYKSLYERWYIVQANYVLTAKDFIASSYWVSKHKPQHALDPQDYDRFERARRLRKRMPQMPSKKYKIPTRQR